MTDRPTTRQESRTLRSKRLRALLWLAADGRCQMCGQPLGDDWQADHVIPWRVNKRTNVHEMQALCAPCNRRKGGMSLRNHQQELDNLCRDIKAGQLRPKTILIDATPGSGKSSLPVIIMKHLHDRFADRLCWVVPRQSLQEQGERAFLAPWLRDMLGHKLEIRRSTNDVDPSRGTAGYVTTYQAIGQNPELHRAEFERQRYILVLDEFHHVEEGGPWHRALQPLIDRARLVVLMTGTLARGDDKPIAFVPRKRAVVNENGRQQVGWKYDLTPSPEFAVIRYSRINALEERAVRRIDMSLNDGLTDWIDAKGQQVFAELGSAGSLTRPALWTALNTSFARQLFDRCIADWQAFQRQKPHSKLLVVAFDQARAREYQEWLRLAGIPRSAVATSDEGEGAAEAIRRYKQPYSNPSAVDALVTVQMAYEGLDVPEITHILCLTHIRSAPWIEQMISRANRVCGRLGEWDSQRGTIYGPNDELLRVILDRIKREQDAVYADRDGAARDGAGEAGKPSDRAVPINSILTKETWQDGQSNEDLTPYQVVKIREQMARFGLAGNVIACHQFLLAHGVVIPREPEDAETQETVQAPESTVSQRMDKLRKQIQKHCNSYDAENGYEPGYLNGCLVADFGKKRPDMTEDELRRVWAWIQSYYPLRTSA